MSGPQSSLSLLLILVNLHNRTGEERRRQTLCDKRDNNFVWNKFSPNFTLLQTDLFVKDQKTLVCSEDYDKTRTNNPVTSVSHKRFAILFLLPTCCVNSLLEGESWLRGVQGVMGRRKERRLVFLLITPRTFFGHASRVFSACNPNRDTWGLVSCKPAICWVSIFAESDTYSCIISIQG